MAKNFVRSVLYGGNEGVIRIKKTCFGGMRNDRGEYYSNVELDSLPYLRTHKPLVALPCALPSDVRAIRAYKDHLLLLNMESGYFGIYHLKDGEVTKTGTTVSTFAPDSDGNDYCSRLLMIDEQSAEIDSGCAHTKLLFFPSKQTACLSVTGAPTAGSALPASVPSFRHAAISSGRLYGSVGQQVYASGAGGCFDWSYDEQGQEPLPEHAWKGGSITDTDQNTAVTALIPYKNTVLVFRERAMQAITGNENPFVLKDLYKVGTKYGASVKEIGGILYFLDEKGAVCYNGSTIRRLPALPEGTVLNGAAGVLDGKYCFYGQNGARHYLYTYDPESDGYARCRCYKKVRELANCADKLYALMGEQGEKDCLYTIVEDRSSCYMEVELPLLADSLQRLSMKELTVRLYMKRGSSVRLSMKLSDEQGAVDQQFFDIFQSAADGEVVLRQRRRMKGAYGATLVLEATGDVTLMGYEVCFTPCRRGGG